jgi:hypothetical protein
MVLLNSLSCCASKIYLYPRFSVCFAHSNTAHGKKAIHENYLRSLPFCFVFFCFAFYVCLFVCLFLFCFLGCAQTCFDLAKITYILFVCLFVVVLFSMINYHFNSFPDVSRGTMILRYSFSF